MRKISEDEVKKRIEEKFNGKYDTSKVKYIDSKTKINLVCPKHGDFFASLSNLMAGKGCPKCGHHHATSVQKLQIEEVIKDANEVHDFKYDYSWFKHVGYKNNHTKFPIICHEADKDGTEHGLFYQNYIHHIGRGTGCPICSGNKKMGEEEIIEKAKEIHGDKYDYSKSHPTSTHSKMTIICHELDENGVEHGEFEMTPHDHFSGQGCPKCKGKRMWDTRGRLTVDDVKKMFIDLYGDEYDYSEFKEYKNNHTKLPVICKKHGLFWVTSNNHLQGKGCPECGKEKVGNKKRLSVDEVIRRIKEVHGDKYIIPEDFKYVNNFEKVKLICPKHSEFWQNPFNLWKGVGCPKCNRSKLETEISVFLDSKSIPYEDEKNFDWLKNYELDFYLPEYNVAIECQGKQHFDAVEFFGGEEEFEKRKKWDEEKKKLCEENNVPLLYFTNEKIKKLYNLNDEYITSKDLLLEEIKKCSQK